MAWGRENTHLHKRTARRRVRDEHPAIIKHLMRVEPLDRLGALLRERRPPLHAQRKVEVRRDGVLDAREHAPEHHAHARVEHVQQPRVHVRVAPPEHELLRQVDEEAVEFFEEAFERFVRRVNEARRTATMIKRTQRIISGNVC